MNFGQRLRHLPNQDASTVLTMAERFQRAQWAHSKWAEGAKVAVDFMEGRQWTQSQLAQMARQKRPALSFNIIAPLVRLIMGYQTNNRTDITFEPGNDHRANEEVAKILTMLEKSIAKNNMMPFIDTEVFLDGIITGRGFYRDTLDFTDNDLGEIRTRASDPFQTYLDPDGDSYDLNENSSYVQTSKMVNIDEIEAKFGKNLADMVRPLADGRTPIGNLSTYIEHGDMPVHKFGRHEGIDHGFWDSFYSAMGDFADPRRKNIRIIETEHKKSEERNVFIDLETGDKKIVPKNWNQDRINKALYYAEQVGNPVIVERRTVDIMYWTTICGDAIIYNDRSPYSSFSITPFFPYFRRGETRGAVDDMIDPQREKNKFRSLRVEHATKTANGGWMYHENSLDRENERRLRNFGSAPGVIIKYRGDPQTGDKLKPEQIQPATQQQAFKQLEIDSDDDIRRISGINESALGQLDRVQSGRAIEARQRQAVLAIQLYMDNFKRTKVLVGKKHLGMIQDNYTEPRMYRVTGEDGKLQQFEINQMMQDPASGMKRILNNVTIGRYTATVDEQPLSATFAEAQFEEMLVLLDKMGPAIGPFIPAFADLIMENSSMPNKAEWIRRMQMITQQQPAMSGQPGQPPAGDPAALPPPQGA